MDERIEAVMRGRRGPTWIDMNRDDEVLRNILKYIRDKFPCASIVSTKCAHLSKVGDAAKMYHTASGPSVLCLFGDDNVVVSHSLKRIRGEEIKIGNLSSGSLLIINEKGVTEHVFKLTERGVSNASLVRIECNEVLTPGVGRS